MRKHLYLMVDTETAGTLNEPLVYDLGMAVVDKKGKVYKTFSLVIADIFYGEKERMQSAYFSEKIPMYHEHIRQGIKTVCGFWGAYRLVWRILKQYNIKAVVAHNASFDEKALNNTINYLSNGTLQTFFPEDMPIWCTLAMARSVILTQTTYKKWCEKNGYLTKRGQPRGTAEILYRYISNNPDFIEAHTGLQDVLIEKEIFVRCMRQHKKMEKFPIYGKYRRQRLGEHLFPFFIFLKQLNILTQKWVVSLITL